MQLSTLPLFTFSKPYHIFPIFFYNTHFISIFTTHNRCLFTAKHQIESVLSTSCAARHFSWL
ncbi:hypothetical protein HanXRQr2_Chr04g0163231 [Helianthus annuus]|uniref:Uncharacterized protein n=1 Tax=Helianthus annuus TaxID=4232 RepID=A0A9K3NRJ4_HELAN|nr:hypothetical protein HanXRQr2_Chr04g0163231 [Helianthus annuus]KAJ0931090.1 hypothetical protein HanPSC8_Chr04g0157311 [Helianthus annuus]